MIQYKRIAAGFYTDTKIQSYGPQQPHPTTFLLWLLTGPVLGILPGCASIGRYGLAEQIRWPIEQVDAQLDVLVRDGIVQFDPAAPMIYMPNAIKFNAPRSPLNVTSWASDWRKLPNCVLKERAWHMLRAHCDSRDDGADFKGKRTAKNSFYRAFELAIDRPPESPIVTEKLSSELSCEHSYSTEEKLNRNRNRNRNRNSKGTSRNGLSDEPSNVTPIDCQKIGGQS